MTTRTRLGNLIGPLILIALGVVFLLYNLDLIQTNAWELLRDLWPVLVVAVALQMMLAGGSLFFPLTLMAFAAGFLLRNFDLVQWDMWAALGRLWPLLLVAVGLDVIVTARLRPGGAHVQEIYQSLEGVQAAEIEIEPGMGSFQLGAASGQDALLSGTASLGQGERVVVSRRQRGQETRIKVKQDAQWFFPFMGAWLGERRWHLAVHPSIPLSVKVDGGMGPRTLDLRDLHLTHLKVDGGLGSCTVILPARGRFTARVDGGLGDTSIRIPAGMAARIHIDTGLGSRRVQGAFQQQGNVWVSPEYETAEHRVDLNINQGLGSLTVVQG